MQLYWAGISTSASGVIADGGDLRDLEAVLCIFNEVLQFFLIWFGALSIPILGMIEAGAGTGGGKDS